MPDLADRISRGAVAALDLAPFDDRFGKLSRQVLAGGASRFARVIADDRPIDYVIPVGLAHARIEYGALVLQDRHAGILWREASGLDRVVTVTVGPDTTATFSAVTLGGEQWMRFDVSGDPDRLSFLVPPVNSPLLRSTLIEYFRAKPGQFRPDEPLPEPERTPPAVTVLPAPVPVAEAALAPSVEHAEDEPSEVETTAVLPAQSEDNDATAVIMPNPPNPDLNEDIAQAWTAQGPDWVSEGFRADSPESFGPGDPEDEDATQVHAPDLRTDEDATQVHSADHGADEDATQVHDPVLEDDEAPTLTAPLATPPAAAPEMTPAPPAAAAPVSPAPPLSPAPPVTPTHASPASPASAQYQLYRDDRPTASGSTTVWEQPPSAELRQVGPATGYAQPAPAAAVERVGTGSSATVRGFLIGFFATLVIGGVFLLLQVLGR